MKAILVVELDDDIELDNVEIRYVIQDIYGMPVKAEVDGLKLKPMPSRMKVDYDTISSAEVTEKVVAIGYNACIDAILGGE